MISLKIESSLQEPGMVDVAFNIPADGMDIVYRCALSRTISAVVRFSKVYNLPELVSELLLEEAQDQLWDIFAQEDLANRPAGDWVP